MQSEALGIRLPILHSFLLFFFNDTATTEIYTLSLHDALPIYIYGQDTNLDTKLSLQDSSLLNNFWTNFKSAINTNDKMKLATLCKFPFYCRPCKIGRAHV